MTSRRHCQKPAIIGRFRSGSTAGRIDETLIADSCREQPLSRVVSLAVPKENVWEVCVKMILQTLARNLLLPFTFPWLHRAVPKAQPSGTAPG